jgi:hypothetical protein
MKLNQITASRFGNRVVRRFGGAKLVRRPNGRHELVGGTHADRSAANEWASLFAHQIVFTHSFRD